MKFIKHIDLSRSLIEKLKVHFPIKVFKSHSHLFYEGHIPISGFLIIDGTIQVSKKNKLKKLLSKGTLVGLRELLSKTPSNISVEVFPNTEVFFLDRSTVLELKENGNSEIKSLMKFEASE